MIVVIFILIVLSIYLLIGDYFFKLSSDKYNNKMLSIMSKNTKSSRTSSDIKEIEEYLKDKEYKDYFINSFDNLKLHSKFYKASNEKRVLVCFHGYRGSSTLDFCYVIKYLLEHNTSLLLVDERCCGKSEGRYITFGSKEKYDVSSWVSFIKKKTNSLIYIYGVSLGGATVLMSLGVLKDTINGVIDDCGYISGVSIFKDLCNRWFHIPYIPLIYFVNISCILNGHYNLRNADARNTLKNNNIPILFIHGDKDDFVLESNTEEAYNLTKGPKEKLLIIGAKHAESSKIDNKKYTKALEQFFSKYD